MKTEPKELKKFTDVTIVLAENGWVIVEGALGERGGMFPARWIAKTPQEIAEIFTKYAIKPALYKEAK